MLIKTTREEMLSEIEKLTPEELANLLEEVRKNKKLAKTKAAALAGVNFSTYNSYENAKARFDKYPVRFYVTYNQITHYLVEVLRGEILPFNGVEDIIPHDIGSLVWGIFKTTEAGVPYLYVRPMEFVVYDLQVICSRNLHSGTTIDRSYTIGDEAGDCFTEEQAAEMGYFWSKEEAEKVLEQLVDLKNSAKHKKLDTLYVLWSHGDRKEIGMAVIQSFTPVLTDDKWEMKYYCQVWSNGNTPRKALGVIVFGDEDIGSTAFENLEDADLALRKEKFKEGSFYTIKPAFKDDNIVGRCTSCKEYIEVSPATKEAAKKLSYTYKLCPHCGKSVIPYKEYEEIERSVYESDT